MTQEQKDLYRLWKDLVNMTALQLERFIKSDDGKKAGLSVKEASKLGIRSGQSSARAIIKMKRKGVKNWTKNDWKWAQAQVNFLTRTIPQRHDYFKKKKGFEYPTRHLLSLLIWGHNPFKT